MSNSSPNFTPGQVPTFAEWNSYFAGKVDALNGYSTAQTLTTPTIDGALNPGTWISPTRPVIGLGFGSYGYNLTLQSPEWFNGAQWIQALGSNQLGQPNGVASLDNTGNVPASQLANAPAGNPAITRGFVGLPISQSYFFF